MAGTLTKLTGMQGTSLQGFLARGGQIFPGTFTYDTSYPIGGESIAFPFTPGIVQAPGLGGYDFEWDYTNSKLRVLRPGTPLIIEEVVTVSSNVGTLKHKPFYIMAIVSTGGTAGPCNIIPTGATPLTVECAVTFTDGTITFLSTDVITSAKVTYIPLHETGPFSAGNLVIDELVTASASKTDLAYQAAMVQYVYDNTDSSRMALEPVGEAPTASGNAVVDIDDGSNDTNIDVHSDDAANILKVTYVKYSFLPPALQLGDGDLTLASEIYNFTTNHYRSLAIPGLGCNLVGEATAANVELIWSGPSGSVGAGVPTLDFELNQWSSNESGAITTLSVPIVFIDALHVAGHKMEVASGTDLSSLVARVFALRI